MSNLNINISSSLPAGKSGAAGIARGNSTSSKTMFADTVKGVEKYISKVDTVIESSNTSIKDLLSGKNENIIAMVSATAKADMSFKLLVGVRNKLIEAYKQTMNMPL